MPDSIDAAVEDGLFLQERAIEAVRQRAHQPTRKDNKGMCWNCDEPTGPGIPYCDSDCRDDHQARLNSTIKKRN